MKKILILVLAAMLLMSSALAQVPAEMKIVNCQEWVSLRSEPDSAAQRFAEVKLNDIVYGFYGSNGEFSQCVYEGLVGYILTEYLEILNDKREVAIDTSGEPAYSLAMENGSLKVWKDYGKLGENINEMMYVSRLDASGKELWSYATESLGAPQVDTVDAFVNEPAGLVMVYNTYYGLIALDAETGAKQWVLPVSEASLGGSLAHAVGADGTMYIGGYLGPDPVAISAEGKVLFETSSLHEDPVYGEGEFFWLYEIAVTADGITACYEGGADMPVKVVFDMNGKMLSWEEIA